MNSPLLLDRLNTSTCISKESLQEKLSLTNHVEAAKIIKKYHISAPKDYVRACGKSNFTDFPLSLSPNTHERYIVTRPNNNSVSFQSISNFSECIDYMDFLINHDYFINHNSTFGKIKGYFKDDDKLILGRGKYAKIFQLEDINITKLVRRNYYLDKNHLSIQTQVSALGAYLGYESILARNDKNKKIGSSPLSTFFKLTFQDLNLQNMYCEKTTELASYTDVIWANKKSRRPKYAIEVELGEKISDCFTHFSSLNYLCTPYHMINVFLADDPQIYKRLYEYRNLPMHKYSFPTSKLAFLSIQDFFNILALKNTGLTPKNLEKELLKKLIYVDS